MNLFSDSESASFPRLPRYRVRCVEDVVGVIAYDERAAAYCLVSPGPAVFCAGLGPAGPERTAYQVNHTPGGPGASSAAGHAAELHDWLAPNTSAPRLLGYFVVAVAARDYYRIARSGGLGASSLLFPALFDEIFCARHEVTQFARRSGLPCDRRHRLLHCRKFGTVTSLLSTGEAVAYHFADVWRTSIFYYRMVRESVNN